MSSNRERASGLLELLLSILSKLDSQPLEKISATYTMALA